MNKILKKAALFTDIHFGAKGNSERHNHDCLDYMDWFCEKVKNDSSIDHVIFLGDYFEHRNAISGMTLNYAYEGAKKINDLVMPSFWLNGNHDCFTRTNRNVVNTKPFEALSNITMINDITVIDYLGKEGVVLAPYLFREEYPKLLNYIQYPYLFIHGEFKGFVVTGDTVVCEHGADHNSLKAFKRIASGHFHKKQTKDNLNYIGNTFATSYADVHDINKGMCTLEYTTNELVHINWEGCPYYGYLNLSDIIKDHKILNKTKASFKVQVDTDIEQSDLLKLRESLMKKYDLRELVFEEMKLDIVDGDATLDKELKMETVENIIKNKLRTVEMEDIDNEYLVKLYEAL